MYIFGTFACRTNIQIISFALPVTLIMPTTISALFGMCDMRNHNPCAYTDTIPPHLWFQCPEDTEYMTWFADFGSCIGILWLLSSLWIARHIWFPKSLRMSSIDQMFGRPYYSGKIYFLKKLKTLFQPQSQQEC